jgi:polyisoprenoid-binding protein YceI
MSQPSDPTSYPEPTEGAEAPRKQISIEKTQLIHTLSIELSMKMKQLLFLSFLLTAPIALQAAPKSFDFKDPKGVNHVIFMLDAPLEFISGNGKDISGTVEFDKENPAKTNGEIVLAVSSLSVTSEKMTKAMKGKKWLNLAKNKEIRFKFDSIQVKKEKDGVVHAEATGVLTLMGISKDVTAPVKITLAEGVAGKRSNSQTDKRDLLVVRSDFEIQLDRFGLVMNAATKLKVANDVQIKVVIAGYEIE